MRELHLEAGWYVVAETISKPLALVKFSRGAETQRARFDIDKRAFIDTIPSPVSPDERERLALALTLTR